MERYIDEGLSFWRVYDKAQENDGLYIFGGKSHIMSVCEIRKEIKEIVITNEIHKHFI